MNGAVARMHDAVDRMHDADARMYVAGALPHDADACADDAAGCTEAAAARTDGTDASAHDAKACTDAVHALRDAAQAVADAPTHSWTRPTPSRAYAQVPGNSDMLSDDSDALTRDRDAAAGAPWCPVLAHAAVPTPGKLRCITDRPPCEARTVLSRTEPARSQRSILQHRCRRILPPAGREPGSDRARHVAPQSRWRSRSRVRLWWRSRRPASARRRRGPS